MSYLEVVSSCGRTLSVEAAKERSERILGMCCICGEWKWPDGDGW